MAEKEYIEREAAKKVLADDYAYAAAELLDTVPTANVQEVRLGKWVKRDVFGEDPIECNCCGNTVSVYGYDYCPHCGAKMDKE